MAFLEAGTGVIARERATGRSPDAGAAFFGWAPAQRRATGADGPRGVEKYRMAAGRVSRSRQSRA